MKTLSIILPVHNQARSLERIVNDLMEFMPQRADRFEIIIVDDGSDDGTADIAADLSLRFANVLASYHGCRRGETAAIETGRQKVKYDLTFVQNEDEIEEKKIRSLLKNGTLTPSTQEAESLNTEDRLVERLMKWGMALKEYRSKGKAEIAAIEECYVEEATPETSHIDSPKYTSIPEKRLAALKSRDLENAR